MDDKVTYLVGDTVRIGDELIKVSSVAAIGTGSATISTLARGVPVTYTNTLSLTEKDDHASLDEVFVCEVSNDERLDDLLKRILVDVGIPEPMIPLSEWAAEVDEWLPTARINTLWIESKDTAETLERILTDYLLDMWFDPVAQKVKLSAVNVWKESGAMLKENNQIDFESISKMANESLRATRALVIYDKRFLATSDSVENYKKASLFKRTELESDDLFGEPKTKRFEFSHILTKDSADALVNRYVNRYIDPHFYQWKTQERKLNFKTGDIVDIDSSTDINFDGSNSATVRAQIVSIKPNYTPFGRDYSIKALSYEPVFADNSEIVISGITTDINLFIQYAGLPAQAVSLTFVFDGAVCGSSSASIPAIKAGAFHPDSVITIILANGADLQAKGGDGGNGQTTVDQFESRPALNGENGGIVFDAMGIETHVYFSGATPASAPYNIADGFIRAPSGGSGGHDSPGGNGFNVGTGGNGGNGRAIGVGGNFGITGTNGVSGVSSGGSLSNWGVDGADNDAFRGDKGKGIVDGGAVVTFYPASPSTSYYINGGGDHP